MTKKLNLRWNFFLTWAHLRGSVYCYGPNFFCKVSFQKHLIDSTSDETVPLLLCIQMCQYISCTFLAIGVREVFCLQTSKTAFVLGLAMRLRIHAVHADDPHMRICASRCACKNLDVDQPHIEQKRVLQIHVV